MKELCTNSCTEIFLTKKLQMNKFTESQSLNRLIILRLSGLVFTNGKKYDKMGILKYRKEGNSYDNKADKLKGSFEGSKRRNYETSNIWLS